MCLIIYLDVLLFTNLIINYCILSLTEKFLHLKTSRFKLISASLIGAISSLIVFLPTLPTALSYLIKIIIASIMCCIGFKTVNLISYFKAITCIFTITIIFCGASVLIYQNLNSDKIAIVNDIVYFQIDPILLILISILIYLFVILIQRAFKDDTSNSIVNIRLVHNNHTFCCVGKIDTGCTVVEPFSSAPVIIVERSVFKAADISTNRIIPFKALGNSGIINAFKPDKLYISNKEIFKKVYVGIYENAIDLNIKAIINSEIIR